MRTPLAFARIAKSRSRFLSVKAKLRSSGLQILLCENFQSQFKVFRRGEKLGSITLNVPGKHNISNALGVIALATELGVSSDKIAEALESLSRRAAAFRGEISQRTVDGRGRLRASSERDSRDARDGAQLCARAHRGDVPAASLLAHARFAAGVRRPRFPTRTASSLRIFTRRAKSQSQA